MYSYEIQPSLQKILNKLFSKDKALYEQVLKKIEEVMTSSDIEHYKNLRFDMKDKKRAHIGHFVLVFAVDHERKTVSFEDYDHHDKIYQ